MTNSCQLSVAPLCRVGLFLILTAACGLLSGCGNGLSQVSGTVTLDGQPLRGGKDGARVTVQFQPVHGVGVTAVGLADENGKFVIATGSQRGLPPGEYFVTCSASQVVQANGGTGVPSFRQLVDPKYANAKTSGLTFTVAEGSNQIDIPLTSRPGAAAQAPK